MILMNSNEAHDCLCDARHMIHDIDIHVLCVSV